MKICLIAKHFAKGIAEGHYNLAWRVYSSLRFVGVHPKVYTVETYPTDGNSLSKSGFEICTPPHRLRGALWRLGDAYCAEKFVKKMTGCDIIHFLNVPAWIMLLSGFRNVRAYKLAHIWYHNKLTGSPFRRIENRVLGNLDKLVVTCDFLLSYYSEEVPSPVVKIPPPLDLNIFRKIDRNHSRDKLNLDVHGKLVGFIGDTHPSRGLHLLMKAVKGTGYELVIAVPTEKDEERAKEMASSENLDKVTILGRMDRVELFYNSLDLLVLPFIGPYGVTEPPLVVLEALASGVPIITTREGGIGEFVMDGHNGIFVEPRPDSLRIAISRAIEDPMFLETISINARSSVNHLSLENIGRRILLEYEELSA